MADRLGYDSRELGSQKNLIDQEMLSPWQQEVFTSIKADFERQFRK